VSSAGLDDEMKRRDPVENGIDHGANPGEGEKEADGGNKQASPRLVGNAIMQDVAERRTLQQQQEKGGPCNDEQQDDPGISHAP